MQREVEAGVIPARVPRPLTDAEKQRLRDRAGGVATDKQLSSLERKFSKPEHHREQAGNRTRHGRNGWG